MSELWQVARQEGPRWAVGCILLMVGAFVVLAGGRAGNPGVLAGGLALSVVGALATGRNSRSRAWWRGEPGLATRLEPPAWWLAGEASWRAVLRAGMVVANSGVPMMGSAALVIGVRDAGWFGGPAGMGVGWGALVAATVVIWVGAPLVWASVVLANRPAVLVPPHLRGLPGLVDDLSGAGVSAMRGHDRGPRIETVARYEDARPPAGAGVTEVGGQRVPPETLSVLPAHLALGLDGAVWIGELWVSSHFHGAVGGRIQRLDAEGFIREVVSADAPLDGQSTGEVLLPGELAVDVKGQVYFTLPWQRCVARVDPDGVVRVVAGDHRPDGGDAQVGEPDGWLARPSALAIGPGGDLFVGDDEKRCLHRITTDGRVETVAGTGKCAYEGDGGPATAASFVDLTAVAVDAHGGVYVSDLESHCVRYVAPDGRIETVAGTGKPGFRGDGGPSRRARLNLPYGLALGPDGEVYIADGGNARIRRIDADGVINTVAGTGGVEAGGDGGPARKASLMPAALALDRDGNLYVSDAANRSVRKIIGLAGPQAAKDAHGG